MSIKRGADVGTPRRYADYLPVGGSGSSASFGDTWIWLSLVLYVVALALILALLAVYEPGA